MTLMPDSSRWEQRLEYFLRALKLLEELNQKDLGAFSLLEKEGLIQRFEYTFELAWKVLKDKMESDGILLDQISPRAIVRQACQANYIKNVEVWMDMIVARNLMSHTYDFEKFDATLKTIQSLYIRELQLLAEMLTLAKG